MHDILLLPGDAIGPEVTAQARRVPERGLLRIREELGSFANLRPAAVLRALEKLEAGG